jgi:predicted TPR repeat methyltransferase
MESTQDSLFEQAMARYQDGAPAAELLDDFIAITEAVPRQSAGWTCLAWLQLLCEDAEAALRSARTAVKLNPQDPQARINLSLAMLETQAKGVREQVQVVQQVLAIAPDVRQELQDSIADGFQRRPGWPALTKVKAWLEL